MFIAIWGERSYKSIKLYIFYIPTIIYIYIYIFFKLTDKAESLHHISFT